MDWEKEVAAGAAEKAPLAPGKDTGEKPENERQLSGFPDPLPSLSPATENALPSQKSEEGDSTLLVPPANHTQKEAEQQQSPIAQPVDMLAPMRELFRQPQHGVFTRNVAVQEESAEERSRHSRGLSAPTTEPTAAELCDSPSQATVIEPSTEAANGSAAIATTAPDGAEAEAEGETLRESNGDGSEHVKTDLRRSSDGRDREDEKVKKMRTHITREVLSTEKTYVQNLEFMIKNYRDSMVKENVASTEEVESIFSNIVLIWNFNKTLLYELENRFATCISDQPPSLGEVFIEMAPYMKMYTQYVNNYNRALATLAICKSRRPFITWLQQANIRSGKAGDLNSFLILPVQRLPRYILLLQDLLRNTPTSHEEYSTLSAALEKVRDVTKNINEMRRYAENLEKVFKVQTKLTQMAGIDDLPADLVKPSRVYVGEGELVRYDRGRRRRQLLYLFNDILLCVDLDNAFSFWYSWRIDTVALLLGAKVVDCSVDMSSPTQVNSVTQEANAFKLTIRNGEVLVFICASHEEKEYWIGSLQEQITQLHKTHVTKKAQLEVKQDSPGVLKEEDFEMIGGNASRGSTQVDLVKEGYLTKQGGFIPSWKRRWFILQAHKLCYYESQENDMLLGYIDLRRYTVHKTDTYLHSFELRPDRPNERIYKIAADTENECQEWYEALKLATPPKSNRPQPQSPGGDIMTASGLFSPLRNIFSLSQSTIDESSEDESDYGELDRESIDPLRLGVAETRPPKPTKALEKAPEKIRIDEKIKRSETKKPVENHIQRECKNAEESEWECPQCTFLNKPTYLVCEICNHVRDTPRNDIEPEDNKESKWLISFNGLPQTNSNMSSESHVATTASSVTPIHPELSPLPAKDHATGEMLEMSGLIPTNIRSTSLQSSRSYTTGMDRRRAATVAPSATAPSHSSDEIADRRAIADTPNGPSLQSTPGNLPKKREHEMDFASFKERLNEQRLGPMMAGRMQTDQIERSRRVKKGSSRDVRCKDDSSKSNTVDASLLMRLRSTTASVTTRREAPHQSITPGIEQLSEATTSVLYKRKAENLTFIWSNHGTSSKGEVSLFMPEVSDGFASLGFTALPCNLPAVKPAQPLPFSALLESSSGNNTFCPTAWIYAEATTSDTTLETSATTSTPSSGVSAASLTPLLVRPKDFRVMWKETGLKSTTQCSIWRPIPPSEEYAAVGFLVSGSYQHPDAQQTSLRCVHKSLLVPGHVERQPVWTNKGSSSHYKISIWRVAATSGGEMEEDRFFIAVPGHDPPTMPVYSFKPGVLRPYSSPP